VCFLCECHPHVLCLLYLTGAASTRVSNELGAGRPHMLVPIVAAATMLGVVISTSSATLFILARCGHQHSAVTHSPLGRNLPAF